MWWVYLAPQDIHSAIVLTLCNKVVSNEMFKSEYTLRQEEEDEQSMVLPPTDLEPGILPTEIRKLVESRRQVKQLMKVSDISQEQLMQVTTSFKIK